MTLLCKADYNVHKEMHYITPKASKVDCHRQQNRGGFSALCGPSSRKHGATTLSNA